MKRLISPRAAGKIIFSFLFLATILIVTPVVLVVGIIVARGSSILSWEFLTAMPRMGMRSGGIFPAIVGTTYLVAGTLLFSLPVGIFAAIYLSEYSKRNWLTRLMEVAIVNLAGVPSVVYGLLVWGFL